MHTRLRFKFTDATKTVLMGPEVLAGNDMLVPSIDVGTLELFLTGTDGKVVSTHSAESVPALKKLAKTLLMELGALFNAEVRNGKLSRDTTTGIEELEPTVSDDNHSTEVA